MTGDSPRRGAEIWVVTDGRAGNENPALGLADAVAARAKGATVVVKRIALKRWSALLPARLWADLGARANGWPFTGLVDRGRELAPPYPDLVIGAGRRSAPIVAALRKLGGGMIRAVQLLDPQMPAKAFDLVAAPAHDRLSGKNVIKTVGSLHRIGPQALASADPRLDALARPLFAVLVGGASASAGFAERDGERLLDSLARLAASGAGLAVTASRRTPDAFRRRLGQEIDALGGWFWRGDGANPYFAMLGRADAIIVTADSVNMASEACAAGKPVYVASLDRLAPKLQRFHRRLLEAGAARPLPPVADAAALAAWSPRRLDEVSAVADRVAALLEP